MKKYINFIKLFFILFKELRNPAYSAFQQRQLGKTKGYGLIRRPLDVRFQQNQKGKLVMSQKDLFVYMLLTAFEQPEEELKEELLVPFMLLFMIYCNEKDSE